MAGSWAEMTRMRTSGLMSLMRGMASRPLILGKSMSRMTRPGSCWRTACTASWPLPASMISDTPSIWDSCCLSTRRNEGWSSTISTLVTGSVDPFFNAFLEIGEGDGFDEVVVHPACTTTLQLLHAAVGRHADNGQARPRRLCFLLTHA